MTPDRRTLLALFAIAFGLRVLYAALVGTTPELNPSPVTYDFHVAERIYGDTKWVGEPFTPTAPGYPLFLAAVFRVLGVRQWAIILLQAFVGAATVLFLYRIGERRLGRGVGLLSALWIALFVHQIHFASVFVRDTITTFAFLWFCYTMVREFRRMRQAVWAGIIYAVLIHFDSQFLVFFPVVVVFFALFATRHRLLNLQYLLLFAATVFMLSLPWTARNWVVYGEVTPVGLEAAKYLKPVTALTSREVKTAGGHEKAGNASSRRERITRNSVEFWRVVRVHDDPTAAEPAWSLRHNLSSALNFGLLLPFFVVGIVFAFMRRSKTALLLVTFVVVYYLTRAIYGGDERLRLPVEPVIALVAFYGLTQGVRAFRTPKPPAELDA